jgi:hypothetical protein
LFFYEKTALLLCVFLGREARRGIQSSAYSKKRHQHRKFFGSGAYRSAIIILAWFWILFGIENLDSGAMIFG